MTDSQGNTEIEVTDEMLAAGLSAYMDWQEDDGVNALLSSIFLAMRSFSSKFDSRSRG